MNTTTQSRPAAHAGTPGSASGARLVELTADQLELLTAGRRPAFMAIFLPALAAMLCVLAVVGLAAVIIDQQAQERLEREQRARTLELLGVDPDPQ